MSLKKIMANSCHYYSPAPGVGFEPTTKRLHWLIVDYIISHISACAKMFGTRALFEGLLLELTRIVVAPSAKTMSVAAWLRIVLLSLPNSDVP